MSVIIYYYFLIKLFQSPHIDCEYLISPSTTAKLINLLDLSLPDTSILLFKTYVCQCMLTII